MLHHRVQNLRENSIIPKWQAVNSATKGHLLWYKGRLAVVGLPCPGTHFESLPIDGWKDSPGPAGHPAPIRRELCGACATFMPGKEAQEVVANNENLEKGKATQFRSGEEAARNGSKGGIASGAARRRKKSLKEAADLYLSLPVTDKRRLNKLKRRALDPEDIDNQMAMVVGLTEAATAGDARAAKVILEMLGDDGDERTDLQKAKELLEGIDSAID